MSKLNGDLRNKLLSKLSRADLCERLDKISWKRQRGEDGAC